MKTQPIVAARIEFADGQPPRAPDFGDVYHAAGGALEQAAHVFLGGNGLPARWAGRRRFVVVETGFGLGNNFLATWNAWRADPQRCDQLVFISVERHPPRRADLERAHADSLLPELARQLVAGWPPLTANLHPIDFEQGRVRLLLALGDVGRILPQLQAAADAFYLDGFAPRCNPAMWDLRVVKALARLAAPGATAATWSVAQGLHDALTAVGFEVRRTRGFDRKKEMTAATFAPAFTPRRAPGRRPAAQPHAGAAREAVIVGAGLAGACAAASLAQLGWRCTVLDRHAEPAQEASGNPAGLFHGTAHGDDGVHARFTRAAALLAARRYAPLLAGGRVTGRLDGLVRMRPGSAMPGLPADYLRAVDGAELQALAGLALAGPAWFYPGGGWIAPAELVRVWLGGPGVDVRSGARVDRLERRGDCWHAIAAGGATLAAAPVLVLAAGPGVPALADAVDWPLRSVRGQVTWIDAGTRLVRPVSGQGYALSLPDGRLLCGATTADADADANLRDADHAYNLARLRELTGIEPAAGALPGGRMGWRSVALDRLPLVGAVPLPRAALAPGARLDQARLVPRVPGLFVLGGLASRGLTWGPLAGDVLAAWIDGAPLPLEADLLDAIDPARWIVRTARASAG